MSGEKTKFWRRLLLSETLADKNKSHKIAYIAIMTALNIAVNALASLPLGFEILSLTILSSVLTGILIGPLFGFAACFIGDTLGFMIGAGGANGWTPWIGLATAMMALIAGFLFNGLRWKLKGAWAIKLALIGLITFLVCTVGINTTAMYFLWYSKTFSSWGEFLIFRLLSPIQIMNNLLNYGLLFAVLPTLGKIKPLKISID